MRTLLTVLCLVAALALAACGGDDDDGDDGGGGDGAQPSAVDTGELGDFAGDKDHPVYWAGERDDTTYELTETSDGSVYVRYLTGGAETGDPKPLYLTVGTYPRPNAFKEVQTGSKSRGARTTNLEGGGIAVVNRKSPQSAYFAYPDSPVAVEVFHPAAGEALRLVTSGGITPVE